MSTFLETFWAIADTIGRVPLTTTIAIFIGGAFFTLLVQAAYSVVRYYHSRMTSGTGHSLKVVFGEDSSRIRMTKQTIDVVGLSNSVNGRIRIISSLPMGRSKRAIETLGYRQDGNLDHNTIEMPRRTFRKLYGQESPSDAHTFRFEPIELKGFAEYWFDPDDRTRFANRFAIWLGVAFLTLELAAGIWF